MFYNSRKKILNILATILVVFSWGYLSSCSKSASEPKVELSTPVNSTPVTGAMNITTNILLKWECNNTGGSYSYDLYFGIAANPPLLVSAINQKQYQKDSLLNNTKYYWKVVVKDGNGNQASNGIWSFTTEPKVELSAPANPTPAFGALNITTNILLKWECNNTGGSYTYDLYFGTTANPPLFASNLNQKQYQKDSLLYSTKYYWTVRVKDGLGNQASSQEWEFTIEPAPLDGRGGGIIMYTLQPSNDIHQLYVMNGDGSGARKLITASIGLNHAGWSPDGTKIAAVGYMDRTFNTWSIHTFNADGTNLRRLTLANNISDTDPAWSPDGMQIAFTRMYPADPHYENSVREIWLMNADGSNQRYFGKLGFQPKFSPDGRKLLYTSKISENWEIYTCNIDGTNEQRLTNNNSRESDAVWSPDGTKIAFDSDMDGNSEIYVMNADGTQLKRITNNNSLDAYPRWSPDGSLFVFNSDLSGSEHWETYIMNVDGTNIRRLTYSSGDNTTICPTWKPVK